MAGAGGIASKLKEALLFKTDGERLVWFHSLAPDEQAEVLDEAKMVSDRMTAAFQPMMDAVWMWWLAAETAIADAIASAGLADTSNIER